MTACAVDGFIRTKHSKPLDKFQRDEKSAREIDKSMLTFGSNNDTVKDKFETPTHSKLAGGRGVNGDMSDSAKFVIN